MSQTVGKKILRVTPWVLVLFCALSITAQAAPRFPWFGWRWHLVQTVNELKTKVADLETWIADLANSWQPSSLTVDCPAGETIAAALATQRSGPLTVTIVGVCGERVLIERDDVTLQGANPGDGLDGTGLAGTAPLVTVSGAHRVLLDQLTLTPLGLNGLVLKGGASVEGRRLEIDGAQYGVRMEPGTDGSLILSNVLNSVRTGIWGKGSHMKINSALVQNNRVGVSISSGTLQISNSTVEGNIDWGLSIIDNAHADVFETTLRNNEVGVFMRMNASALIGTGGLISDNHGAGIRVWDGSTLNLGINATVENNLSHGVLVSGNSVVVPLQALIQGNQGDGIRLTDTSLAGSWMGEEPTITGNTGWGVSCEGFPGDARLQSPGYGVTDVFANTAGQIDCPGYQIP
jgi:hypothetical protein